jgi:hypothetical protein
VLHCRENNKNKGGERYLGKIRKETVLEKYDGVKANIKEMPEEVHADRSTYRQKYILTEVHADRSAYRQ